MAEFIIGFRSGNQIEIDLIDPAEFINKLCDLSERECPKRHLFSCDTTPAFMFDFTEVEFIIPVGRTDVKIRPASMRIDKG